jgi:glycosyltransferase involved in cell wall biosynthesis
VIDLHNIESIWHQRSAAEGGPVAGAIHTQFARAAAKLEKHLLPQFDLALVTSKLDGDFLRTHFPELPVAVVKNTMPSQPQPAVMREDVIVFSGYMEYAPNATAVLDFASNIWPIVSKQRPDTRWKIVGKSANRFEQALADVPRICLVSDPEDAMIEIASASVAVVPLRVGSGTRLKIVEAWAAGTPVVSTTLGAEGLECEPERDLLIADVSEEFAKKVINLLQDTRLAREIGANGRSRFEAAYTWQTAWDELAACDL